MSKRDLVLEIVNNDDSLPNFKRTTFYKLLKKMQFAFKKRGRDSLLIDREEIIVWRRDYLRKIRKYREQGRTIYYLDETWINAGHTKNTIWVDESIKSCRQARREGLSTGLKNPSGKGRRLIICHIGGQNGFVENGLWFFESNKSGDYHEEMNGESFEKWFSTILPTLENNAVIVINISFDHNLLKAELLVLVKENKEKYNKYRIDEMARETGRTVLRLPPYHCELNPIELIWAQIKGKVAAQNSSFKISEVRNLFLEAIRTIGPDEWQKCKHVIEEVEEKMWQLDNIMESTIERVVINLSETDTEDGGETNSE
ncbi:uncharacterized protein LOC123321101 [Coccinella septempunctata]|uniref:uncharacterized protein LOC123321101 n=1 Tax=Coccinella septempunctata TaxID=41139 RepID=UPI001D097499|nr:uncharacterized protein LOC123321101 [Coccinella septempunctata]